MRFDKPIYMQYITTGNYDVNTGDYKDDIVIETKVYASITDTTTETLNLVYGELKQGSLTIRLQNHFDGLFSRIRIDNKIYRVDYERKLKTKHVFIVSEVQ